MADIEIRRAHPFDADEALTKLKSMMTEFQTKKPDLVKSLNWSGSTATAEGKYFKGTFGVQSTEVVVSLRLIGFAAKMAKGMVRDQIEKALDKEFS